MHHDHSSTDEIYLWISLVGMFGKWFCVDDKAIAVAASWHHAGIKVTYYAPHRSQPLMQFLLNPSLLDSYKSNTINALCYKFGSDAG
jgi:hypothetical protein